MTERKDRRTPCVVSLDIGTQGAKAAALTRDGGILAEAFVSSKLIRGAGGLVEQRPDDLLGDAVSAIAQCVAALPPGSEASAVALSGQMAGTMGVGSDGEAVTPYDSWLDTRCEAYFDAIKSLGESAVIAETGCPVTYAHGPKTLWWKHERPETYARIAKFVVPTAYVAGRLTGAGADGAYIDTTHLHFSGFADTAAGRWSDGLLSALGVEAEKMPRIVEPWERIGGLTARMAEACGLPAGTPVLAGCGDTAASTLGAGIVRPGMLFDVAGTASVLACCVDDFRPDTEHKTLITARSVVPGLWAPLAYINGGGQCIAWFRDQLRQDGAGPNFDELNRGAASMAPGADGLFFVPHFGGRVCPNNPLLRGAWIGLNWSHDKYGMYRSILESIAYEYQFYLGIVASSLPGARFDEVRVVGGGAKGALFNQIKADVLGIPYAPLRHADTGHLGNLLVAGYALGWHDDFAAEADRLIGTFGRFEPNPEAHRAYEAPKRAYPRLLEGLTELQRAVRGEARP
ncbi:xylulokinase [Paenibacillus sp.]|uniref:xylulokinase n=1 Tax=Paenibacillus sp. TaxID=58172 RepID=UPI002D558138|nr:FGGY family carbohydrate kinase [Paenibacillus sp.]HZG56720.1 FGGY family carbohydrate kinase [Paenibacillus sp.]